MADMINGTLAVWIWARLPVQDRLTGASRAAHLGPLRITRWHHTADQLSQHEVRPSSTGFDRVVAMMLPQNWVQEGFHGAWSTYDRVFLEPIRARLSSMDDQSRPSYSIQARRAATRLMKTWDYLPCSQKQKVWSWRGSGRTKQFMLYKNPTRT